MRARWPRLLTWGFLPWMESAPRTVVFAMAVVVRNGWRCLRLLGSQGRAYRIGPCALMGVPGHRVAISGLGEFNQGRAETSRSGFPPRLILAQFGRCARPRGVVFQPQRPPIGWPMSVPTVPFIWPCPCRLVASHPGDNPIQWTSFLEDTRVLSQTRVRVSNSVHFLPISVRRGSAQRARMLDPQLV